MLEYIDNLLDHITMYRLLFYYLIALVVIAMGLSLFGDLHYSAISVGASALILVGACYVINKAFAYIFNAPTNVESVYITALILALIITPMTSFNKESIGFLLAASGLAMASKYILTIKRKHIFNPAAIAVVLTSLGPKQSASWWVGTSAMLPFVLIGGILLVRKIRRGQMVSVFFASALLWTAIFAIFHKLGVWSALDKTIMTSSMFFLGFVMLTEPLTSPPTTRKQNWYAALTGFLFPPQVHIMSLYSTPELTLTAANLFSYIISPKTKLFPVLKQKLRITPDSADFIFNPGKKFAYEPGQYMEFTLPHQNVDNRGNRRYFTLASSPTEADLRIGVKFYNDGSTFKESLLAMTDQTPFVADQIAGNFTLPKDPKQKLVFIAGGIGITPYRSMVKYLLDTKQVRDIILLYSSRTADGFAYRSIFEQAEQQLGIEVHYIVTGKEEKITDAEHMRTGFINAGLIKTLVPDFANRHFYISGTHEMVVDMEDFLKRLSVPSTSIKKDFFSGYA